MNVRQVSVSVLWLLVFGAAIMALEILSSSLMAPYFGASVYTWGSIISVFLVLMSAGYVLGGNLSRKTDQLRHLAPWLGAGSLAILAIPILHRPVCTFISDMDLGPRGGPLCAALVLMGLPIFLLSMTSPFVVGSLTARRESAGVSAGVAMGISTVGSFAGTLSTSFWLIDILKVSQIVTSIGVLCLMATVIGWVLVPWRKPESV